MSPATQNYKSFVKELLLCSWVLLNIHCPGDQLWGKNLRGPICLPLQSLPSGLEAQGILEDYPIYSTYMEKIYPSDRGMSSNRPLLPNISYKGELATPLRDPFSRQPPCLRSLEYALSAEPPCSFPEQLIYSD